MKKNHTVRLWPVERVIPILAQLSSLFSSFLLVTALSADAFVASFAYGTDRIRIPPVSVLVINGICSAMLCLSLLVGALVRPFVPAGLAKGVCFALLFVLGLVKVFDGTIKAYIRKRQRVDKKIAFSALHLRFILHVYADPEDADRDRSQELSPAEAAPLAVALSLDGLTVGFGAGLASLPLLPVAAFSLAAGVAAVILGCQLGNQMAKHIPLNLSWLSGALLMILAFCRL